MERANTYTPGHPWYYKLGGSIPRPKQIFNAVKDTGYQGYRSDIDKADQKSEPHRSAALRDIREEVMVSYRRDMSRYRELAGELRRQRQENGMVSEGISSNDLHTGMSLKHNHLYNDFAHLIRLEELLSYQPDLFG